METPQDDVSARREARRKKILENANNRLGKITGRDHSDEKLRNHQNTDSQSEPVIYPDPEDERDVYVPQSMPPFPPQMMIGAENPFSDQQQFFDMINNLQQQQQQQQQQGGSPLFSNMNAFAQFGNFGDGANPFMANLNADENAKPPETRLSKFLKSKIHIGLLSIFTYLLIILAPFHINVFLIFLLWEITEIFILRQHEINPNGFVNVVFMLGGVSPAKINVFMKWIQLINKILRDVAIFIFFFVLSHLAYVYRYGLSLVPDTIAADSQIKQSSQNNVGAEDLFNNDAFENFDL